MTSPRRPGADRPSRLRPLLAAAALAALAPAHAGAAPPRSSSPLRRRPRRAARPAPSVRGTRRTTAYSAVTAIPPSDHPSGRTRIHAAMRWKAEHPETWTAARAVVPGTGAPEPGAAAPSPAPSHR